MKPAPSTSVIIPRSISAEKCYTSGFKAFCSSRHSQKKISRFRGIPGFKPTENQKIFRICYAWRFFCWPALPIEFRCQSAIRSICLKSCCAGLDLGGLAAHLRTTPGSLAGAVGRQTDGIPAHGRVVASFSLGFGTVFIKRKYVSFIIRTVASKKNDKPNGLSFKLQCQNFFSDFSDHVFRHHPFIKLFGCDVSEPYRHFLKGGTFFVGFLCYFGGFVVTDLRIE